MSQQSLRRIPPPRQGSALARLLAGPKHRMPMPPDDRPQPAGFAPRHRADGPAR